MVPVPRLLGLSSSCNSVLTRTVLSPSLRRDGQGGWRCEQRGEVGGEGKAGAGSWKQVAKRGGELRRSLGEKGRTDLRLRSETGATAHPLNVHISVLKTGMGRAETVRTLTQSRTDVY